MKIIFTIFMICISLTVSAGEKWGNWTVDKSVAGIQIANTVNEAGSVLGVICLIKDQSCNAYILLENSCDQNGTYPMMINSSIGASAVTGVCTQVDKTKFLLINEFENTKNAFESGGEIGFAIPLDDGKFKVVRFSTSGAVAAVKNAMQLPVSNKRSSTKDETL